MKCSGCFSPHSPPLPPRCRRLCAAWDLRTQKPCLTCSAPTTTTTHSPGTSSRQERFSRTVVFYQVLLRAAAEEARRSTIRIARLSEVQLCGALAVLRQSRGTTSTLPTNSTPTPPATSTSLPCHFCKAPEQLDRMVFSKRAKLQEDRQRSEADDAVRWKWVAEFDSFFVGSNTPSGVWLHLRQHRTSTVRTRVRFFWRYFRWLRTARLKNYPSEGRNFIEFLQVLSDNGSSRGVLRSAKSSFAFMEQVSGVADEMVMSKNKIYLNVYAELLAQSLPGLPPRPAPRPTLVLLAALEDYLHDTTGAVVLRLQA